MKVVTGHLSLKWNNNFDADAASSATGPVIKADSELVSEGPEVLGSLGW